MSETKVKNEEASPPAGEVQPEGFDAPPPGADEMPPPEAPTPTSKISNGKAPKLSKKELAKRAVSASTPAKKGEEKKAEKAPEQPEVAVTPGWFPGTPARPGQEIVKLKDVVRSPANTRTHYELKEFAQTLKSHGLLTELLVRPNASLGGLYEIVYGERRHRAMDELGWKECPVKICILSDVEADELRLIENLQRADLTPLEEGEGYGRMVKIHGMKPEEVAKRVGKSKGVVYERLKLLELGPEGRKALDEGKISASIAVRVARRPTHKVQAEAIAKIVNLGITTVDAAEELLRREFSCNLREAPFDTEDKYLVPEVGACDKCPFNSKNQTQLSLGEKPLGANVCTSPSCFSSKMDAHLEKEKEKAEKAGMKWIPPAETRKLFPGGREIATGVDYVDLDGPCYEHPKRLPWRKLVGKEIPQVFAAPDGMGNVHKLINRHEAVAIAKQAGLLGKEQAEQATRDKRAERAQSREDEEIEAEIAQRILQAGITAAEKSLAPAIIRPMVTVLLDLAHSAKGMEQRRGHSAEQLARDVPRMKEGMLRGLLLELVFLEHSDFVGPELLELAKALKLDRKKIEREVKADRQQKLKLDEAKKAEKAQGGEKKADGKKAKKAAA